MDAIRIPWIAPYHHEGTHVRCFEEFTFRELHRTESARRGFAGSRLKSAGLTARPRGENGNKTLTSCALDGSSPLPEGFRVRKVRPSREFPSRLERPVAQQNAIKRDDSNQYDRHCNRERNGPHMPGMVGTQLIQENPVLPGGSR